MGGREAESQTFRQSDRQAGKQRKRDRQKHRNKMTERYHGAIDIERGIAPDTKLFLSLS